MYSYLAYGLGIQTQLPIPELVAADAAADVCIHAGKVDIAAADLPSDAEIGAQLVGDDVLFQYKGVAKVLVSKGRQITFEMEPGGEHEKLRLLLLGPSIALALWQRGRLLLHASSSVIGGSAVAFLGSPGSGKSTTAAALYARGHSAIADDMVAVDADAGGEPVVYPGFPQLTLWPEALAYLGDSPEAFPRRFSLCEKRVRSSAWGFSHEPRALKRIYLLEEGETIESHRLDLQTAFTELMRHSYAAHLLEVINADRLFFHECAKLAGSVPVYRLRRPRSLPRLTELMAFLEQDLKAHNGVRP